MANNPLPQAEQSAQTPPTVVGGLGYPNGRAELSPAQTGWRASAANQDGSADQTFASVTGISTAL